MVTIRDKIDLFEVNKLNSYDKNNKKHPEDQISLLVQNIDKFGFTTPLLIDKDKTIIAGHGRLEAAKRLGIEKVPCILINDLNGVSILTLVYQGFAL